MATDNPVCDFTHESLPLQLNAVGTCSLCERSFCDAHKSKIEPTGCCECFTETTLKQENGSVLPTSENRIEDQEASTSTNNSDVQTPEATTLRVFRPVGSAFVTTLGKISTLNDTELDNLINEYKQLIHDAQASLDYRRITHSAAELEKSDRRKRQTKRDMFHQVVQRTQDGGSSITIVRNPNFKTKQASLPKESKPAAPPMNPALAALLAQLGPEKFQELLKKVKL